MLYDINGNKLDDTFGDICNVKEIGKKIIDGTIKTISLIGDSITDGGAGTGYNGSSSTALSTNTEGYCWANMLKAYLYQKYGTEVTNYGQYGSDISTQLGQLDTTVPTGTDLVIWLTGTNNRGTAITSLTAYGNTLKYGIDTIMAKADHLIVMSGIPATKSNEDAHSFSMAEISDVIIPAVTDAGCKFIPMYNLFNEWLRDNGLVETVNDYFDGYGIHPNDAGYHIMLQILLRELGVPVPFYEDLTVAGDYYPFT